MKGIVKNRLLIWLIAISASISSCSTGLEKKAFVEWVRDYENGLRVRKQAGDYIFDLQYQPLSYVLLQRGVDPTDSASVKEIDGLQYYTLTIALQDINTDFIEFNVSSQAEKQQKLYYFSYLFQEDIHLEEEDGNVIPCALFHFERSSDLKNSRTFVLAFENRNKSLKESRLVVSSPVFGSFPVKLIVSKENIPGLSI